MYIASKSAASIIRSFVSPVINSLPNSSSHSGYLSRLFGGDFKTQRTERKILFSGYAKKPLWYRYIKKPRKTVDFPWLLKYLIEKS